MQQPDAKTKLKEAFDAAKVPAEVEVYSMAQHGWCVPDMPPQPNGQPIYNKADAETRLGQAGGALQGRARVAPEHRSDRVQAKAQTNPRTTVIAIR